MKTKFYYFLALVCLTLVSLTSCRDEWEINDPNGIHGASAVGTPQKTDTVRTTDTIITPANPEVVIVWSDKDTVIIEGGTVIIYRDTTGKEEPYNPVESYVLGSNKTDNGTNYVDVQPTSYLLDGEVMLNTDVNRSAEISNEVDTFFVTKVSAFSPTVSRPTTNSSYDVRGDYDINTGYRDYTVTLNDGSEYKVNTETESASGMYDGEKKDLLYRMVQGISVVSVNDEMTNDTIVKNAKVYRKANRTMQVEVKSLNRPLMGPEVVTLDTLTISSVAAAKNNGIAVVYVEDGTPAPSDTTHVDPDPTPGPDPSDTTHVDPDPTPGPDPSDTTHVVPDDGYTINGEKIKSITFSYTIGPDRTLKEVLLVRTEHYVMPIVSKQKQAAVSVPNPDVYNSVAWVGYWVPATLELSIGFEWQIDGESVASATDAAIDWLATNTGISNISRSDFLKNATFVNEGTTTRVYVNGNLYMVLQ